MKYGAILLGILALPAAAHEVHHHIEATEAVVVTLTYANGEPFAYEKYTLTPAGQGTPQQVGNTDARGRIAFVPGEMQQWRVQASSADGHGTSFDLTTPAIGGTQTPSVQDAMPRWLLAVIGLSMIFGLFGLFQLLVRKKP